MKTILEYCEVRLNLWRWKEWLVFYLNYSVCNCQLEVLCLQWFRYGIFISEICYKTVEVAILLYQIFDL